MFCLDDLTVMTIEDAVSTPITTCQLANLGTWTIRMEHTGTVLSALDFSTR